MSKDKMNIRDYITIGIIFVLQFAIYIIIGTPIGSTVVGLYLLIPIMSVPWGILSILMYSRVPIKGAVLVYSMIFALIQLMNFWVISVISIIFAVINELIWRHRKQKRFVKMLIAHTVFQLGWLISSFLPLFILKDMFINALSDYSDLYNKVFNAATVPLSLGAVVLTIIGSVVGAALGRLFLNKHFIKAGIV